MDVTLQRHCARYIYVVPDGLRELLNDISREVLRSQPEDMYTFIADYLDALLITRENARVAAKFVTHMTEASETIVELLQRTGMSREEVNRTASVIQEAFKNWQDRRGGILKEDEDAVIAKIIEDADIGVAQVHAAASVIQSAFKTFKQRQSRESKLLSGIVDWRVAARSAIKLYRRCGVTPEEATRAANLIKAAYKGYYTRRAIRKLNEEPESFSEEESEEESLTDEESRLSETSLDKRKGVRIDYTSVVHHVDFGDEELISREMAAELDTVEEVDEEKPTDFMLKVWGEDAKPKKETRMRMRSEINREFIEGLLTSIIDRITEIASDTKEVIKEETVSVESDPEVDEEKKEPTLRAPGLQARSQTELEQDLKEAKAQMIRLQHASKASLGKEAASKASLARIASREASSRASLKRAESREASSRISLRKTASREAASKASLGRTASREATSKASLGRTASKEASSKVSLGRTASRETASKASLGRTPSKEASSKTSLGRTASRETSSRQQSRQKLEEATTEDTQESSPTPAETTEDDTVD